MNEWYARDISRKIRSSQRLRGSAGVPLSLPPYGYIKDPDNPKQWIVDDEAAAVVRYIYQLCIDGVSEYRIADRLEQEKILKPTEYWKSKGIRKPGKNPLLRIALIIGVKAQSIKSSMRVSIWGMW